MEADFFLPFLSYDHGNFFCQIVSTIFTPHPKQYLIESGDEDVTDSMKDLQKHFGSRRQSGLKEKYHNRDQRKGESGLPFLFPWLISKVLRNCLITSLSHN